MKYLIVLFAVAYSLTVNSQEIFEYSDVHSIGDGQTLHLLSNDAEVRITGTNRSDASIEIYREAKGNIAKKEEFRFDINEKNGDLYVTERRKQANVSFMGYLNIKEYTITIALPHNVHLEIEGDDDNYEIKNIDGEISLENEDGNINIYDSKTPNITIKAEDGNIRVSDFKGDFKTNFEDGNLSMSNCTMDDFDVYLEDGNINMTSCQTGNTNIKAEDGNINLDVVRGNLSVSLDDGNLIANDVKAENIDIKGQDGDIELGLHMSNSGKYKVKLDDGDIDVELLSGGGTIKVKCDDGDVKLRSKNFNMLTDEDHYKEIETTAGGSGKMEVRIEDGNVHLGK